MLKSVAIQHLGGSSDTAAKSIGITRQAVDDWPEVLPQRIADRVIAALVRQRKKVPKELLSSSTAEPAAEQGVQ